MALLSCILLVAQSVLQRGLPWRPDWHFTRGFRVGSRAIDMKLMLAVEP